MLYMYVRVKVDCQFPHSLTDEVEMRGVLFSDVVKPLGVASMFHVVYNTTAWR